MPLEVVLRDGENRVQAQGVDQVVATLLFLLRDHKEANRSSEEI